MTVGRCGSTALMRVLQACPDIATPDKNLACIDNELLHPERVRRYAQEYAALTQTEITTPGQLMRAFYRHNGGFAYAGFKSMPNRHRHFQHFVAAPDIRFITLIRRDIHSTVASFLVAMLTGGWRRDGGAQSVRWTFDPEQHGSMAASNLQYVLNSIRQIERIPNRIALVYEDLCREDFHSPELDDYFARPIRLENPKPPLHGGEYVANWPEFHEFLTRREAIWR